MKFFVYTLLPLSILLGLFLQSCDQQSHAGEAPLPTTYIISGTVDTVMENGEVILALYDPVMQKSTGLDTATISPSGTYAINFTFDEPDLFRLNIQKQQKVMLAIDEGQSSITVNAEGIRKGKVSIEGSPDSDKLLGYETFRQESNARLIQPPYAAMRAATKAGNQEEEVAAVKAYAEGSEEHRKELIDYTVKNIGTSIALYGTMLRWTGDDEVSKLEALVSAFKAMHPDLKMTQAMEDKVQRYKKVAIGAITPAFSLADTAGVNRSLDELKGKYTLLDFWASWCGPCLLQVPDLQEAYTEFHDRGFEIVSVSVDRKADRWKAAIVKYEMGWPHVSDLKGWASETANDYNVTFIPFNLLIDQDGKIIAKNLHSKELLGMLGELLAAE